MGAPEHEDLDDLLERARAGDVAASGQLLEPYRGWMTGIARQRIDSSISARLDPEEVVQQALLEATRGLARFRGASEPELRVWLVRVLERGLAQAERAHLGAEAPEAAREERLDDPQPPAPPAEISSASQRASRAGERERLLTIIELLPADQRVAVRLRHLEGRNLEYIASELERTPVAAAGLIKRGLASVRALMDAE